MKRILAIALMFYSLGLYAQVDYLDESKEAYQSRMKWFKDAKYGMFIHFGLYSQLGGDWEGKTYKQYAEWIQANADIPSQVYAMLTTTFNPKDFDADFIARTAKAAGMKKIVITSKHHEGFCLWDTKQTDYNAVKCGPGRDLVQEFVDLYPGAEKGLVLMGAVGTGKTHLAVSIARACIRAGRRGRFFNG